MRAASSRLGNNTSGTVSPAPFHRRGPDAASEAAALAQGALEGIDTAVAILEEDGRVLYSNRRFDEIAGPAASVTATALLRLIDSHDRKTAPGLMALGDRTFKVTAKSVAEGVLVSAEDVTEVIAAQAAEAAGAAQVDPLTSLPNRLNFRQRLTELLQDRQHAEMAVLAIDLHRFRAVNESLGQEIGDALLRVVGDRLRSALGPDDLAARLGGDEYAVVQLRKPQPTAADALARRLIDLLGRSYIVQGQLLNISASIGVSLVPESGADHDGVLKSAHLALHRAKREGGGHYCFYEPAMDEQMQARRSLELNLRRALAMRELSLVYQPQFNIRNREITGFEALMRWDNPERGRVSPAEFIPIAEETGLVVPMGAWALRAACREAVGWEEPLTVAVNVSAIQFRDGSFVDAVAAALAETGLEPRRLELEITESVLLGDSSAAIEALHRIRSTGVRVAMDDFGTGYSSLSYLRSFPFDKIKIDQGFVRSGEASGEAIVRAIAALGASLAISTTAEGVETDTQLARIAEAGCTDVQGYLISRPLPAGEIPLFLSSRKTRFAIPGSPGPSLPQRGIAHVQ